MIEVEECSPEEFMLTEDYILNQLAEEGLQYNLRDPEDLAKFEQGVQRLVDAAIAEGWNLSNTFNHPAVGQVWIFK